MITEKQIALMLDLLATLEAAEYSDFLRLYGSQINRETIPTLTKGTASFFINKMLREQRAAEQEARMAAAKPSWMA